MDLPQLDKEPCECLRCRALNCFASPGVIHPAEITRIVRMVDGEPDMKWCQANLCISWEQMAITEDGLVKLPTLHPNLVNSREVDGITYDSNCTFLAPSGGCCLEHKAPCGCSSITIHMDSDDRVAIMAELLIAVKHDAAEKGPYYKIVEYLCDNGGHELPDAEKRVSYARHVYKELSEDMRDRVSMN